MKRIAFICHGNICRSPMAEFLFRKKIADNKQEEKYFVQSFGTSAEELNNPVYPPVRSILNSLGIDCSKKRAQKIKKEDYSNYDYFLCMDSQNVRNLMRIFEDDNDKKVYKLLEFVGSKEDVTDPYYYNNYDKVYDDIDKGVNGLYKFLEENYKKD